MKLLPHKQGSPEWLEYRRLRVSGSTAAGILGAANPRWSSPLTEWARLTGKTKPSKLQSAEMEWGTWTESVNRQWYEKLTGRQVEVISGIAQHDTIDWLVYSPDGRIVAVQPHDKISLGAVWEGKSPGPWASDAWETSIPLHYQVQVQVGMEVMGADWCSFCALVWPRPRPFDIPRDQRFIDACMAKLIRFMDYNVAKDIPPHATAAEIDRATLKALAAPREWAWSDEVQQAVDAIEHYESVKKRVDAEIETRQARLIQITGAGMWKDAKKQVAQMKREQNR